MLISIIVPIYNVESFLEECLDSLVKQSNDQFEAILVDDGSIDGSGKIAKQYQEKYPHLFKYCYKNNGGLSDARNYGLSNASGDYVTFLDSDDYLCESTIETLQQQLLVKQVDIICFGMREVEESGQHMRFIEPNSQGKLGTYSVTQEPGLISSSLPNACNKLIKLALFIDNGINFPKGLWYEDLGTLPKLFFLSDEITYINNPLYFYRNRDGAITKSFSTKVMDIYEILADLKSFFSTHKYSTSITDLNTWYINLTVITLARLSLCPSAKMDSHIYKAIEQKIITQFPDALDILQKANSKKRYKIFVFLIRLRGIKLVRILINTLVEHKAIRV